MKKAVVCESPLFLYAGDVVVAPFGLVEVIDVCSVGAWAIQRFARLAWWK